MSSVIYLLETFEDFEQFESSVDLSMRWRSRQQVGGGP